MDPRDTSATADSGSGGFAAGAGGLVATGSEAVFPGGALARSRRKLSYFFLQRVNSCD